MPRVLANWLQAYGEYTEDTGIPSVYNLWTALSVLAAAAQRKIYHESAHIRTYPNLYVTLVGAPGSGKSTAMEIGRQLMLQVPEIHLASTTGSPEAVWLEMSKMANLEHQSITVCVGELGTFLGPMPVPMVEFLTYMWDSSDNLRKTTIKRGDEVIPRPWLNLLACTTPKWMGDHLGELKTEGGFSARMLFVYADGRASFEPYAEATPRIKELREQLLNDLAHIANLNGVFDFEGGREGTGFKRYRAWFKDVNGRVPSVVDDRVEGYFTRKPSFVMKLAMLLSLSQSDDLVIREVDFEVAWALLEGIEPGIYKVFNSVGRNQWSSVTERMLHQIKTAKGGRIDVSELYRANQHDLDMNSFRQRIIDLIGLGEIKSEGKILVYTNGSAA